VIYAISLVVSFVSVFMKGFQHKNVIGDHKKAVFFTSYFMAAFDVASVYLIIEGGIWIAVTAGTGAAFGMVTAMAVHDRIFKKNAKGSTPRQTPRDENPADV